VQTPSLVYPRELGGAFEFDEKLALEIQELVEIWKEEVDGVLVDNVAL